MAGTILQLATISLYGQSLIKFVRMQYQLSFCLSSSMTRATPPHTSTVPSTHCRDNFSSNTNMDTTAVRIRLLAVFRRLKNKILKARADFQRLPSNSPGFRSSWSQFESFGIGCEHQKIKKECPSNIENSQRGVCCSVKTFQLTLIQPELAEQSR